MLSIFRDFAKSPFAALIILPLLIVAFVFIDTGSIFSANPNAAVNVGSQQVTPRQLQRSFDQQVRSIQQQDPSFQRQQALEFGLDQQVVDQLVTLAALDNVADRMGLSVSEDRVNDEVTGIEAFANPFNGEFDQASFVSALGQAGYSPREFLSEVRRDLVRSQLTSALLASIDVPDVMTRARYSYSQELRRMDALLIPPQVAGDLPEPTTEELQAFLVENESFFQLPEQRRFTLVRLFPEDLVEDAEVSDEDIRRLYDTRLETGQLADPATRSLRYWILSDESAAREAALRVAQGETLDAVIADLGLSNPIGLDTVERFQIPDEAVADAAFNMVSGDVSFAGSRLIAVDAAVDPYVPGFEEIQFDLRVELAQNEVQNQILDQISELEEARASGLTLSQAAAQVGIPVEQFDWLGQNGFSPDRQPVESLFRHPSILQNVFQLPAGIDSDPIATPDNGYFIVQVDEIQSPQVPPLADIRDQVEEGWRVRTIDDRLQTYVDDALARAEAGEDLNVIAESISPLARIETATLRRDQNAGPFNAQLVSQAFAQNVDVPFAARSGDGSTRAVVIVQDSFPPSMTEASAQTRAELENALVNDLSQVLQREVVSKVNVQRNQDIIDVAVGRTQLN